MVTLAPIPAPAPLPARGADQVVETLREAGISHAFGVPGGAISAVYDALLDAPGITVITTHDEGAAVFAAAAYGAQTGTPAVVLVTTGPGVLHATHALASARCDHLPLVLLAGEVPRRSQGRYALQDGSAHDLDVASVLRPLTKRVYPVPTASALGPLVHQALDLSLSPPAGPVALTLPADLLLEVSSPSRILRVPPPPVSLDLPEIARVLDAAEDIVLFAGSGCRGGEGPRALLSLAERLGARVLTTPKAKGVFPESHPLSRGIYGVVGGHPSASETLDGAPEVLLVLGSSLGELATGGWHPRIRLAKTLIQVDADPTRLGRNYPVDIGLACTIPQLIRGVLPHLTRPSRRPPAGRLRRLPRGPDVGGDRLHPVDFVREAQHALPPDAIFAVDSGEHTFFAAQHLHLDAPDAWFCMLGLGSMGSGINGALGLALAQPGRTIACLCGDGGLLMSLGALATAAAHRARIRYLVFGDGRLGMVEHGHRALYGRTPSFFLGDLDLCAAARALGVPAWTVSEPGGVAALAETLDLIEGPALIVGLVDPAAHHPKGGRLSTLADRLQELP